MFFCMFIKYLKILGQKNLLAFYTQSLKILGNQFPLHFLGLEKINLVSEFLGKPNLTV